ncbi:MAG: hypothetical protein GY754_10065 [bacterium]|nr:hypothetical protein [bacterium]
MKNRLFPGIMILLAAVLVSIASCKKNNETGGSTGSGEDQFTIEQTLSEGAQRNTIAFAGLAYITGDLCADSFLPPGKIADYFGFQYLRDNDDDGMGHNTSFVTKIANNVLYALTDSQVEQLAALAEDQIESINEYAYTRFPLMDAFRRLMDGEEPEGMALDKSAVMEYSAQLFRIDGEISLERAKVFGEIIRALDESQLTYLDNLAAKGMLSWPDMEDQINPQDYDHDVHVAIMTYASQLFSWYAGSTDADTYFCPEREAMYFGAFYLKDIPAMGNDGYSIDTELTASGGEKFLDILTETQAELVTGLVDLQTNDLLEIAETRNSMALELRGLITGETVDSDSVLALAERYGELDGEMAWYYVTRFAEVNESLSSEQKEKLEELRDLDDYPCSGAYCYSENIEMPDIIDTDFLFAAEE